MTISMEPFSSIDVQRKFQIKGGCCCSCAVATPTQTLNTNWAMDRSECVALDNVTHNICAIYLRSATKTMTRMTTLPLLPTRRNTNKQTKADIAFPQAISDCRVWQNKCMSIMHNTSAVRHTISDQLESNSANFLILKFIAISSPKHSKPIHWTWSWKRKKKQKTTDDRVWEGTE